MEKFFSRRNPLLLVVVPLAALILYAIAYEAGWISRDARIDEVSAANPHLSIRPTGVGELFDQRDRASGASLFFTLPGTTVRLGAPARPTSCLGFIPPWVPLYDGKTESAPVCFTVPLQGGARLSYINFRVHYASVEAARKFYNAAFSGHQLRTGSQLVDHDPEGFQDDYSGVEGHAVTVNGLRWAGWQSFVLAIEFQVP
ncbi:MAG: hypothetical protein IT162_08770 [Bryobacterales bacterium]|nr:hypothetical protein [Bryobacterales bacterium]